MNNVNAIQQHLNLLGTQQRDKITGYRGCVVTVAFDAYGCVQAILKPKVKKGGEMIVGEWFDVKRLVPDGSRLMDAPAFGAVGKEPGPEAKPAMPRTPMP